MQIIYVARSAKLGVWGAGVGLGKHLYKVGVTDQPLKPLLAAGWAGETDWKLLGQRPAEVLDEAAVFARLATKEKLVEPAFYPKIKGAAGIFKVSPVHVENQILVARAMAGEERLAATALKPRDFADYLLTNALADGRG